MRTVEVATGRQAVLQVCQDVLAYGFEVKPRGQRTKEVSPMVISIADPSDTMPDGINRKNLLPAIGAVEALQNVAGVTAPWLMDKIMSYYKIQTARFDRDIPTYGARLAGNDQLGAVVRKLREDPDSRQAVALIWRPEDMESGLAHNLCTIGLQFMLRDGKLKMFAHMRSNDAWYGLCYDLFQFAQLQLTIANTLGVEAGEYVHTANSMHLYERHWKFASELEDRGPGPVKHLEGLGRKGTPWLDQVHRARQILFGQVPPDTTASEDWYLATLKPFREAAG